MQTGEVAGIEGGPGEQPGDATVEVGAPPSREVQRDAMLGDIGIPVVGARMPAEHGREMHSVLSDLLV